MTKHLVEPTDDADTAHAKRMANAVRTLRDVQGFVDRDGVWIGSYFNARITSDLTIETVPQSYVITYTTNGSSV